MAENRYKRAEKVFPISLGCGGREFEPRHSDQKSSETERFRGFFIPFQPFFLSIAIQILLGLEYNNQIKLAKDNPQKKSLTNDIIVV